jgi:hypothetical protein
VDSDGLQQVRGVMPDQSHRKMDPDQTMVFQIRIQGHLGGAWRNWFEGFAITREDNGDTLLTGPVADQAALFGLLKKVRNLGIPLLSVNCVDPGSESHPGVGRIVPAEDRP